jgi:hypothetical protein
MLNIWSKKLIGSLFNIADVSKRIRYRLKDE